MYTNICIYANIHMYVLCMYVSVNIYIIVLIGGT